MLLLYLTPETQEEIQKTHLHSTMLLLYHIWVLMLQAKKLVFTFHYASTLSIARKHLIFYMCPIYIPLCFYFIHSDLPGCLCLCVFTFHYASTLSAITNSTPWTWSTIYIPLCFYFICISIHRADIWVDIYIPLCFYFITLSPSSIPWRSIIYIPLCFYFIACYCSPCMVLSRILSTFESCYIQLN